jgi:N-acetylglucosaminyldiphosphoundecaprenol N-acetyl-beta-D-mannosaminyltransferase
MLQVASGTAERHQEPQVVVPRRAANELLGVRLDLRSLSELVDTSVAAIATRAKRFSLACANPHSLSVALDDADFRTALCSVDAVVADGVGCRVGAAIAGVTIGPRITGFDYFLAMMSALESRGGGRVFFFGASDAVLGRIRERCGRDFPALEVETFSPPYGEWSRADNDRFVERINQAAPDVLWVAMTAPKQEKWLFANRPQLSAPVIGCIGAVFEYYAGTVRRAPQWVCGLGLEWLYRLVGEPRRLWRRTFVSAPEFLQASLRQRLVWARAALPGAPGFADRR